MTSFHGRLGKCCCPASKLGCDSQLQETVECFQFFLMDLETLHGKEWQPFSLGGPQIDYECKALELISCISKQDWMHTVIGRFFQSCFSWASMTTLTF